MKLLFLQGSYRIHGNTARILTMIEEQLVQEAECNNVSLAIETIHLGHQNILPCRGCRICFDRGEENCPLKDDVLSIKAKMQQAEGLLLASPLYVDDVSGIVKNWIDRMAHVCHRPEFPGKCASIIATTGSSPLGHTFQTMRVALSTWGYHIVGEEGFKMGALMRLEDIKTHYQEKTKRIARDFFYANMKQKYLNPSFLSLMMYKIQQTAWSKESQDTVDYCYWRNKGWLDQKKDFYIAHQAPILKVIFARLVGSIVARFVS